MVFWDAREGSDVRHSKCNRCDGNMSDALGLCQGTTLVVPSPQYLEARL
jgi:hypothetical protein